MVYDSKFFKYLFTIEVHAGYFRAEVPKLGVATQNGVAERKIWVASFFKINISMGSPNEKYWVGYKSCLIYNNS